MYQLYIDDELFPIAPSKFKLKIKGQNQTINLIDGQEVNILNPAGLTGLSFDLTLPAVEYPFAEYEHGFEPPDYYLEILESLKLEKRPFRFLLIRSVHRGNDLFDTNMAVSLEDYSISEDAKDGRDITVSLEIKQYVSYGTKTIVFQEEQKATVEIPRETESAPQNNGTYTVVKGDCLWNIAKRLLGNGSRYKEIYDLNRDQINNPNLIYPGQVLRLP